MSYSRTQPSDSSESGISNTSILSVTIITDVIMFYRSSYRAIIDGCFMEIWYKCCVLDVDRSRFSCFSCKYHPFVLLNFPIWFDTLGCGWFIVHIKGPQVIIFNLRCASVPEECILSNSA